MHLENLDYGMAQFRRLSNNRRRGHEFRRSKEWAESATSNLMVHLGFGDVHRFY